MSDQHKETLQEIMEFTEHLQRQASRLFAEAEDLTALKGMFTDITQKVHEMMLDLHKHKHFRDITNEMWMHNFTLMHHTFVQRERGIIESQIRLNAESIH